MKLKVVTGIMLTLLAIGFLALAYDIQPVETEPTTIIVPDDYAKIQWAIGNASNGDTIFVKIGTYVENITVYKSIILTGEDRDNTIIDSKPHLSVTAHNVTIAKFTIKHIVYLEDYNNFTITNTRIDFFTYHPIELRNSNNSLISNNEIYNVSLGGTLGIILRNCSFCTIEDNTISSIAANTGGIGLEHCQNNTVRGNMVLGNASMVEDTGIALAGGSDNLLVENMIKNNDWGVFIISSQRNIVYHNNFINNTNYWGVYNTTWDNGYPSGGNYWSGYDGTDVYSGQYQNETGPDRIGDTPYDIPGSWPVGMQDIYPLMNPWPTSSSNVTWKWLDDKNNPFWLSVNVTLSSDHPIENFSFNRSLGQISFNITSTTSGFCSVAVPKLLMDGAFKILINDTLVASRLTWNKSHTFIYFAYNQGTHNVKIIGEIITRIRGPDLLSIADVNGDGLVDIVDIVIVALRFGWEEDC